MKNRAKGEKSVWKLRNKGDLWFFCLLGLACTHVNRWKENFTAVHFSFRLFFLLDHLRESFLYKQLWRVRKIEKYYHASLTIIIWNWWYVLKEPLVCNKPENCKTRFFNNIFLSDFPIIFLCLIFKTHKVLRAIWICLNVLNENFGKFPRKLDKVQWKTSQSSKENLTKFSGKLTKLIEIWQSLI